MIISKHNVLTRCAIFPLGLILLFNSACKEKTDADMVMELMMDIGNLAEKKDIDTLMAYLSDDYSDFEGRGREETEEMLKSRFGHFRGIVINMLSTKIDELRPLEAQIRTDVAFSSGAGRVLRKLARYSTDNYRLKMRLVKRQDQWQIKYAEWRYISMDELFPESLSILKKLFEKD